MARKKKTIKKKRGREESDGATAAIERGSKKKTRQPKSRQQTIGKNPNWEAIVTLGEKYEVSKDLRNSRVQEKWDFTHLEPTLKHLADQHPESDFFITCGPPFAYTTGSVCPTLIILITPHGEMPPEFVQVFDPENLTENVVPFSEFGVGWKPFGGSRRNDFPNGNHVYALKQVVGTIDPKMLEMTKLWNLMDRNLDRKPNGDLDIDKAIFEFQNPTNGEMIREVYVKDTSKFSDICFRHGMTLPSDETEDGEEGSLEPDPEIMNDLKVTIKNAFNATRQEREDQIIDLQENHRFHATIKSVKVFPGNQVVLDSFRKRADQINAAASNSFFTQDMQRSMAVNGRNDNTGYINEWYGTAVEIFPKVLNTF